MIIENMITNNSQVIEIPDNFLSKKEISLILDIESSKLVYWPNWIEINKVWYYYKYRLTSREFFNELLGSFLAKYFQLDTVKYEICKKKMDSSIYCSDYYYGVMSENFKKKDEEYTDPSKLGYIFCKDIQLFDAIVCPNINNYNDFTRKLIRLIVLDFYMQQKDRRSCNIQFKKDKIGNYDLCKLYDYEKSYYEFNPVYNSDIVTIDLKNSNTINFIKKNLVFQEELNRLMEIDINKIINEVIEHYSLNINDEFKELYMDYDNRTKTLIKEYKLIK